MVFPELTLAAATGADALWVTIGVLVAVALGVAAGALSFRMLHKGGTNRTCVWSLIALVLSCLIAVGLGGLRRMAPDLDGLFVVFAPLAGGGVLTAVVLAIVGLGTYDRRIDTRGRGVAVASLVLGGAILLIGGIVAVARVPWDRVGDRAGNRAGDWAVRPARSHSTEAPIVREDLNFRYRPPGWPYVIVDAKKFNADASVAVLRTRPSVSLFIIAEHQKGLGISSESMAEIARAHLASGAEWANSDEPAPYTLDGLDGLMFRSTAKVAGRTRRYAHWVFGRGDYCYQLIAVAELPDGSRLDDDLPELLGGFELVDRSLLGEAQPTRDSPVGVFRSGWSGLELDLDGTRWTHWPQAREYWPGAEVAGHKAEMVRFIVQSVPYGERRPHPEALASALAAEFGATYPAGVTNLRAIRQGSVEGRRFDCVLSVEGVPTAYRAWVLAGEKCGYVAAVWAQVGRESLDSEAEQVFQAIRVHPADGPGEDYARLDAPARKALAGCFDRFGAYYQQAKQPHRALEYWQQAMGLEGENLDHLTNALNCYCSMRQFREGLDCLQQHEGRFPDNDLLRTWRAWMLRESGQTDRALAVYRRLFSGGFRADEDLKSFVELLRRGQRHDEAVEALDRYLAAGESRDLRVLQAEVLAEAGQGERAVELLRAHQRPEAFDVVIAYAQFRVFRQLERYKEAMEVCQDLLARGFESGDAYFGLGQAQYGLKWYRQARESFHKALAFWPDDKDVQEYLRLVSAMLGEGDNSQVRQPIEAASMPAGLADDLPPDSVVCPDSAGYGACVPYSVLVLDYRPGESSTSTLYRRVRVLDAGGVSRTSTLEAGFDPLSERLYVNRLAVYDANGRQVSLGRLDDFFVVDDADGSTAGDRRKLNMPVPDLQPGYTVELVLSRRNLNADSLGLERHWLADTQPTALWAVCFRGDANAVRLAWPNAAQPRQMGDATVWTARPTPLARGEPFQPAFSKLLPSVWIADANATWSDLARGYLADIADRLPLDANAVLLARRLVADADSPQRKIEVLGDFVQKTCTYKAIEFGRRRRIPNSPAQTLRNKYGDCKDHAVLLAQLLRAVDVPADLALVSTDWRVEPNLPTLDQFNHMVVCVPDANGCRFLDATNKAMAVGQYPPSGLLGCQALVLDANRPRFEAVPPAPPGSSRSTIVRHAVLDPNGDLHVEETVRYHGYGSLLTRWYLKLLQPAQHEQWAQGILADRLGTVRDLSLDVRNLYEPREDLEILVRYVLPAGAGGAGGQRVLRVPDAWEHRDLAVEPVKNRAWPLEVELPEILVSRTTVELPEGFAFTDEQPIRRASPYAPYCQWTLTADVHGREATIRLACHRCRYSGAREQFAGFQSMMSQAAESVGQRLRYAPADR